MVWHTFEGISSIDQWIGDRGVENACLEAPLYYNDYVQQESR